MANDADANTIPEDSAPAVPERIKNKETQTFGISVFLNLIPQYQHQPFKRTVSTKRGYTSG